MHVMEMLSLKGKTVVLTGGVAHNAGVARMLEEKLGHAIFIPEHAQLAGAIGAAIIARE